MATAGWVALVLIFDLLIAPAAAMYSKGGPVVDLSPSNFDARLREGVWLVEFFAPWCGHCKALKPAWEDVAKGLKGIVGVGAVDADSHKELAGRHGVKGFPTIMFMHAGTDGKVVKTNYEGGRSAEAIIGWALGQAKKVALKRIGAKAGGGSGGGAQGPGAGEGKFYSASSGVVTLTSGNFEEEVLTSEALWMVEFFAPWCGHCKALKPAWEEAAGELKGKVSMGAVDCTTENSVCEEYGVQGFPTIKFFGARKHSPEAYQGGRDSASIVQFAMEKWNAMAPAPEVHELVDQYVFDENCLGDSNSGKSGKQVCFLAFLPNVLDSGVEGRKQYLATLAKVGEKFKGRSFSYFWSQGGSQPELEANVGVGGYGYPALVVLNPSKKMFSPMKFSFAYDHVVEFVNGLRHGGSVKITGELASIKTVNAWDGTAGVVADEDEFSLDDIMGDEL
eukprot:evm.model.scf_354.2 EVM.evm.TU.scf_354.2   scf_354:3633-5375(-)